MAREQRHIGSYRDAELIGRGGFGSVYRADDPDHGRQVAIKVLDVELGEAERRRFDRERRLMGQLGSHPNIISVFDSGYTDRDEAYIVMELATEGSLRSELDRRKHFAWQDAVDLIAPIAKAVAAAHEQGIVHRDIKPDNILIDGYGNPRLTDFGIAALTSGATSTQAASATLAHAAPEVLDGKQGTEATDVYALASTLHTLIAGTSPFMRSADEGLGVMMRRIMAEPPPDLRPLGVPDHVASAIERSLAKSPSDRPLTAAAFAAAITDPHASAAGGDTEVGGPVARGPVAGGAATGGPATGAVSSPPPNLGDHPTIDEELLLFGDGSAPDGPTPTVAVGSPGSRPPNTPTDDLPFITASRGGRRRWLPVAAAVFAVAAIGGTALAFSGGDDDADPDVETLAAGDDPAESSTSTSTTVTTTLSSTTTTNDSSSPSTASGSLARTQPSVSIDCPTEVELGATLLCNITTANVVAGEWSLPGFLSEPLPIQTINGVNEIFLEPTNGEAAGRRYTITATATAGDGTEVEAKRTFLINVPTVSINCPSRIAPGDSVVCEIVSEHAVRGTWEIPGFGGDVIETIPGSNAIFINPNESVIGQTFTATATVEDDFGLSATATSDFTVTASAG